MCLRSCEGLCWWPSGVIMVVIILVCKRPQNICWGNQIIIDGWRKFSSATLSGSRYINILCLWLYTIALEPTSCLRDGVCDVVLQHIVWMAFHLRCSNVNLWPHQDDASCVGGASYGSHVPVIVYYSLGTNIIQPSQWVHFGDNLWHFGWKMELT